MIDAAEDPNPPTPLRPPGSRPSVGRSRTLVWAVLLAAVGLVLFFPTLDLLEHFVSPRKSRFPRFLMEETWLESLPVMAAGVLIAVWVFVFWSLIGSFLNVVVYRLPLGRSVVHGGSRCPRCETPIKWHDNLPVIGWLGLNGRCRACDLPIAARYPIVESVCAGLCTALYFRELVSGGVNLPGRTPDLVHDGVLRLFPNLAGDLVGITLYHCVVTAAILVWGLIAWDRRRVPRGSIARVLVAAAIVPILLPSLHPLGLTDGARALEPDWLWRGLAVSVVGGLAGFCCGLFLQRLLARLLRGDASGRAGQPLWPPHQLAIGLALVGIAFGWQGMLGTTILLFVICVLQVLVWSAVMEWPTVPAELLLVPATFLHLIGWRQLVEQWSPWWPGGQLTPFCLATPLATMIALALALVAIAPAPSRPPPRGGVDPTSLESTGSRASETIES